MGMLRRTCRRQGCTPRLTAAARGPTAASTMLCLPKLHTSGTERPLATGRLCQERLGGSPCSPASPRPMLESSAGTGWFCPGGWGWGDMQMGVGSHPPHGQGWQQLRLPCLHAPRCTEKQKEDAGLHGAGGVPGGQASIGQRAAPTPLGQMPGRCHGQGDAHHRTGPMPSPGLMPWDGADAITRDDAMGWGRCYHWG